MNNVKTGQKEINKEQLIPIMEGVSAGLGSCAIILSLTLIMLEIALWKILVFLSFSCLPAIILLWLEKRIKK